MPEVSLQATADSYVQQFAPTANEGSDDRMFVQSRESRNNRSVIQFDVSEIPANAVISSALLTLVSDIFDATRVYHIFGLTKGWVENTVTWNLADTGDPWDVPGAGDVILGDPAMFDGLDGPADIDIKFFVSGWVSGTFPNYGMVIKDSIEDKSPPAASSRFCTRDDPTPENRPVLVINYSIPEGHRGFKFNQRDRRDRWAWRKRNHTKP
jgi:large repetitive protein